MTLMGTSFAVTRKGLRGSCSLLRTERRSDPGIPEEKAYAHREFQIRDGQFTLKRTLRLPNQAIYAVGKDGSVVARNPGILTPFVVYKEGSRKAVRFVLPDKHMHIQADFEGHIYSMEIQEDGLVIACWKWPVPQ